MSGDTVECFNCGHQNPSWAQVCRSCGYPIQPTAPSSGGPRGLFPTDQASLISIGGSLGAIVAAIILGLVLSGIIPPAPNVAVETPIPTPLPSASASASASTAESPGGSTSAAPTLPGTITFGTGLDGDTRTVTGETTEFTAASPAFAHSISMTEPFAVNEIFEEIVRVADDGTETIVQPKDNLGVTATSQIAGFQSGVQLAVLIRDWGTGNFILRVYRGEELLAEGSFTFS